VRPPEELGGESIDLGQLARVADRHDPLGRRRAELTAPPITGDAITVVIDGHRHGLPEGAELAPGSHAVYVRHRGSIFCLVGTSSGIKQLVLDRELADRIHSAHFEK
jgi:hypothetical protein